MEGKDLPFAGGFNKKGELTRNPGEILETERALPIGYWKGAGLSLLLDILAQTGSTATKQVVYDISRHLILIYIIGQSY